MNGLPQVRPVAMRQSVADAVRRALLEGRFEPGQGLSEVALAAEMKVSRAPVREALLMLEHEGLLVHSQNYGFSVLQFTDEDRAQIDQARFPLEVLSLKLARERITPEKLAGIQALRDKMVALVAERRLADCVDAELRFHGTIWDASGNPWLAAALRRVMIPYFTYLRAFKLTRPQMTAALFAQQHDTLVEFLAGSSTLSAEECVRFHLTAIP